MIVMKFGGTSVASFEAISRTIGIVGGRLNERPVVVVSALSKITDLLYKIADAAGNGDTAAAAEYLDQLSSRHLNVTRQLLSCDDLLLARGYDAVEAVIKDLKDVVDEVLSEHHLSDKNKADIISHGELLSSTIICYAMNARGIRTAWVDVRDMVITDDEYMKGTPIMDEIVRRAPKVIDKAYADVDAVITQGFIASNLAGETTVLGRGGSDYTASIIGMAIDATKIEIWTDVDGVKTADPRKVSNTQSLDKISFEQAAEMAHFGAKVLHPLTMEPAVMKNIPIYVLNSMNPFGQGTAIVAGNAIEDGIKSISSKENITVIGLESDSMMNPSALVNRTFSIVGEHKGAVDMVRTAEGAIYFTIENNPDIDEIVAELSKFAKVSVDAGKTQISVIGKNIENLRGLLLEAYPPIRDCKVYMISLGESYVNISFVVDKELTTEAIQMIHARLFGE